MDPAHILCSAALVVVLGLTGCGNNAADMLASAKAYMAKNDLKAATIQLKNLLQEDPKAGEGRFLLGKVLLEQGDPNGAGIELRRAQELGVPDAEVAPLLARTMLALGQNKELIDRYGGVELREAGADASLGTSIATAQASLGRMKEAGAAVDKALQAVPAFAPALILQARIKAASGDPDDALALVVSLLRALPGSSEGWQLRGDVLLRAKGDLAGAEQAFRKALAIRGDLPDAYMGLASIAFARHDQKMAAQLVDEMKTALPKQPQTAMVESRLAFMQGEHKRARELLQSLLQRTPQYVPALLLAGANELSLNAPKNAEGHLLAAINLAPDFVQPRRLLAQAYLLMRQPGKAMGALRAPVEKGTADSEMLALAGQAALMLGDTRASDEYFKRGVRLRPDDARLRAVSALRRIAQGAGEAAYTDLQSIAATDTGSSVDLALISALLRKNDFDGALLAIETLERKQPENPLPPNLRARALLLRQDLAGARKNFEQALARDAKYLPAVTGLAALDLARREPEAGSARFEALLKVQPRDVPTLMAFSEFAVRAGRPPEQIARLLENAIQADPGDPAPRLALIDHQLGIKNIKAALASAQAALSAIGGNSDLLERLGRLQLASGYREQARSTYAMLAVQAPDSAAGYLGLAQLRLVEQDLPGAEREARRALQHEPDSWPARRMAISLAIRQQRPQDAITLSREQQQRRPEDALGFTTQGELELSQQHWDAAIAAFRTATTKAEPANAPARLHATLLMANRPFEASKFAQDWIRAHPQDVSFISQLGDAALARGDFAQAEQRYQQVLLRRADDLLTLNNVAWLRLKQHKPGARDFAERALALAPDRPASLDTYAGTLAAENQIPKALEIQQQAVAKAPAVMVYRLNLAKLYLQAGNKAQAKDELERLTKSGGGSEEQLEAAQLLKVLTGQP